jgi:post-segregation antitoxin (ccd killing protein)
MIFDNTRHPVTLPGTPKKDANNRSEKERCWAQEHAQFIAAYNQTIETEGLVLEQWRSF